ncbi:GNAT family N-acetyltransferase [Altererythrobacter confluentis]|uniref:GNAT family N-acetyltransferase n=1 Tax=Allopontixanthobacter confluentis TaxID=1849021 RepID=A0A6L7GEZ2_9SPHN|nr:GNAT family N-acetyltransferase [Allopontixanthobacter confluentis]MXP14529.1 GNAT family N-acetyltransferase [Allopontixanthobacter confluentis]
MTDDLDRLMEVMGAAFDPKWGEAWSRRQVGDALVLPSTHYFLIDPHGVKSSADQPVAGFTLSRHIAGEEELLLIAVRPEYRRSGLGKALLGQLAADASKRGASTMFLEMRSNNPAEKIYRTFGFLPIGRRKQYYSLADGSKIDAITFSIAL